MRVEGTSKSTLLVPWRGFSAPFAEPFDDLFFAFVFIFFGPSLQLPAFSSDRAELFTLPPLRFALARPISDLQGGFSCLGFWTDTGGVKEAAEEMIRHRKRREYRFDVPANQTPEAEISSRRGNERRRRGDVRDREGAMRPRKKRRAEPRYPSTPCLRSRRS